jgi:hypothetical protein
VLVGVGLDVEVRAAVDVAVGTGSAACDAAHPVVSTPRISTSSALLIAASCSDWRGQSDGVALRVALTWRGPPRWASRVSDVSVAPFCGRLYPNGAGRRSLPFHHIQESRLRESASSGGGRVGRILRAHSAISAPSVVGVRWLVYNGRAPAPCGA